MVRPGGSAGCSPLYRVACTPNCEKTERIKGAHEHCRRKYAANIRLLQLHLKTHTPPHREPRPELEHTKKNKFTIK